MLEDCGTRIKNGDDPYIQCRLEKKTAAGTATRITWADAAKAIVGREVKIEENNGEWTEGWLVKEVYGTPLPKKLVQHRSHDHTRQRKSSDI